MEHEAPIHLYWDSGDTQVVIDVLIQKMSNPDIINPNVIQDFKEEDKKKKKIK